MVFGFLLTLLACAESGGTKGGDDTEVETDEANADDDSDDKTPTTGKKDASTETKKDSGSPSSSGKDAGTPSSTGKDAGTPTSTDKDSGTPASTDKDAGKTSTDSGAKADAGGGFMLPDLFPTNDAGSTTKTDAGTKPAGDKSGPCKDLQLLCFDIFDMWIINPQDCATCNNGMGCQGCAIPFAF